MRATKSLAEVTRWYFVARNRRVGADLHLLRGASRSGAPSWSPRSATTARCSTAQRDYRGRLNDLLFGFTGEEQYQTMLRLMRDLRRPHLSKTLDPDARRTAAVTPGCRLIDEGLMRRLAGGLEQIETLERGLTRLREVRDRVAPLPSAHVQRLRPGRRRERADALRQAQTAVENAAERLRDTTG